MSAKYRTVVTTAGAVKLAAAAVPGGKKVNLTVMAVGDGGGSLPEPNASQTKLVNEVWRHTLNKISQDNKKKNYIVAELVIPPEVGGFWARELGLYDDAGTLIAVANMAESYKPELAEGSGRAQTCRMVIILSSIESVELSIDSTMVMATQDYVDDRIAEHEQSRRHPDATLKEKGFVQLSSATDSESEALAATPKAVKAVYDLANAKYTAQDATTARKGIVQLSSATDSTSEVLAATPKAVKAVNDNANSRIKISDITSTDNDAVAGRILKVGDYGLSAALRVPAGIDLAVFFATARGLVYRFDNTTYINGPSYSGSTWFDVFVSVHEKENYRTLLAISAYGDIETATLSGSGKFSNGWTSVYSTRKKPSASDVGALPLVGGKMLGDITFKNGGLIFPEEAYKNKAFGRFGTYAADTLDYRWELYAISKANNNLRTNVITADIADISKGNVSGGDRNNSTTTITLHGEIMTPFKFVPGNYSNFDARYQAKGNYTPVGQSYTKAESDARYVIDVQLGAGTSKTTWNTSGNWPKASGYVITSVWKDASDYNLDGVVYAPLQKKIGSTWYTVSGGLA